MKVWEIIGEKASKDLCTSDRSDKIWAPVTSAAAEVRVIALAEVV